MVTDRHDWNWDRLRVQNDLKNNIVRHHRGNQSGAIWERVARSRRTNDHRTWEFFLSNQSAMQAVARAGTNHGTLIETDVSHDFRKASGLLCCRHPKQNSSPVKCRLSSEQPSSWSRETHRKHENQRGSVRRARPSLTKSKFGQVWLPCLAKPNLANVEKHFGKSIEN